MCEEKGNKVLFFRFDDENGTFEALQELTTVPETVTGLFRCQRGHGWTLQANLFLYPTVIQTVLQSTVCDPLTGYMRNVGFLPMPGKNSTVLLFLETYGKCYVANEDSDTIIEFDFGQYDRGTDPNIEYCASPAARCVFCLQIKQKLPLYL